MSRRVSLVEVPSLIQILDTEDLLEDTTKELFRLVKRFFSMVLTALAALA